VRSTAALINDVQAWAPCLLSLTPATTLQFVHTTQECRLSHFVGNAPKAGRKLDGNWMEAGWKLDTCETKWA